MPVKTYPTQTITGLGVTSTHVNKPYQSMIWWETYSRGGTGGTRTTNGSGGGGGGGGYYFLQANWNTYSAFPVVGNKYINRMSDVTSLVVGDNGSGITYIQATYPAGSTGFIFVYAGGSVANNSATGGAGGAPLEASLVYDHVSKVGYTGGNGANGSGTSYGGGGGEGASGGGGGTTATNQNGASGTAGADGGNGALTTQGNGVAGSNYGGGGGGALRTSSGTRTGGAAGASITYFTYQTDRKDYLLTMGCG